MKLTNFLAAVSLFFIATFAFGQSKFITEEEAKALTEALIEARDALDETTIWLQELGEENASLKKELAEARSSEDFKKIEELEEKLREAQALLGENVVVLEEAKQRITDDQTEINNLRGLLQEALDQIEDFKMFHLGGGVSYPLGGKVIFIFNIPGIPLSISVDAGLMIDPLTPHVSVSLLYRF